VSTPVPQTRAELLTGVVRRSIRMAQPIAQGYVEGNMTVAVTIRRPGKPVFDRASGQWVSQPGDPIYDGPARMYQVQGGQAFTFGEEQQYYDNTQFSIPLGHQVWVNDDVEITGHDDASLVGKHYRITSLVRGGLIPTELQLAATGTEPAPNAPGAA
jgi:hypothetical protein